MPARTVSSCRGRLGDATRQLARRRRRRSRTGHARIREIYVKARHGLVTRRRFIRSTIGGAAAVTGAPAIVSALAMRGQSASTTVPWYRRAYLWGQTNITEKDPIRYDIDWWRDYWKRTEVQAVIINAGGIVAYYPSRFPLHHRAEFLGDRDLFGELTKAAHADGIFVMARMDSNRTGEDFFPAHPDWFARDVNGQPYRAGDKYVACINSPYYDEYLPDVLREIIERSRPDGFTDNSWAGLGRESICYCGNCTRKFQATDGQSATSDGRLERPGLSRLDQVELRAPHGALGSEQPDDARGRWPRLHLVGHEQRLGDRAGALVP